MHVEHEQTDELLIRKYLELGDIRSLEIVIDRYLPKALALFTRLTHRTTEAQDLTQGVFLCILRRIGKRAPIVNFAAFFAVCCRNAFRDYLRQKKTRDRVTDLHHDATLTKIELMALHKWQFQQSDLTLEQLNAAISRCLQHYEDHQVRSILSDHLQGLAWKEIAERNGCSTSKAATIWHRSKRGLMLNILREISI